MLPLPVSIHLHLSFGCGRTTVSRSSTRCGHLFAGPGGGFALFQVALQHGEVFAEKPLKFRDEPNENETSTVPLSETMSDAHAHEGKAQPGAIAKMLEAAQKAQRAKFEIATLKYFRAQEKRLTKALNGEADLVPESKKDRLPVCSRKPHS